jgi:hypothetical protein
MPQLRKSKIEKVYLPSFEDEVKEENRIWIKIETPIKLTDFDGIDPGYSQIMQSAYIITSKIKDWNIEDEKGKLPITAENVAQLEAIDFTFLSITLGLDKIMKLTTQKKSR